MASVYEHSLIFNENSLKKFIALIKRNCAMRGDMYQLQSDLVPALDITYNIGAADKRWKNIYGHNLYITGETNEDGATEGGLTKTRQLIVSEPVELTLGKANTRKVYGEDFPQNIKITLKELLTGQEGDELSGLTSNNILKSSFDSEENQFVYAPYDSQDDGNTITGGGIPFFFMDDLTKAAPTNYDNGTSDTNDALGLKGAFRAYKVHAAVFNDYAELRESDELEPGRCVVEDGKGQLRRATERLAAGANIVSDTYGMLIGTGSTPIAVCGRALAYPAEDRCSYSAGDAVCAAPDGTISKMTRDEIKEYPDRIVGYVSEIPEYKTWGSDNVQVNGRIWIKVN